MNLKRPLTFLMVIVLTISQFSYAYAGVWKRTENSWKYITKDGKEARGWINDGDEKNESWYFIDPASGILLAGWHWIDGKCYYFAFPSDSTHLEGKMYQSERTPDGYDVSKTGAWAVNGIEQIVPGKGIITTTPSPAKIKFSIGGGGGGGGSSSSGTRKKTSVSSKVESTPETKEIDVLPEEIQPVDEIKDINMENPENIPIASPSNAEEYTEETEKESDPAPETYESEDMILTIDPPEDEYEDIPKVDVNWFVHFVDKETHGIDILPGRTGTCRNGSTITIGFLTKVKDSLGNTWEAEGSPYEETVFGPGDVHIYIEYDLTVEGEEPEDSEIEEKELLSSWIQKAKLAESLITGENPNEIPDERFFAESEGEVKTRLVSIAQEMPFDKGFDVYVIGNGLIPNGISLKEQFGEYIRYSNTVLDNISVEDESFIVSLFHVTRKEDTDSCLHEWESAEKKAPSCLAKGVLEYSCRNCSEKRTVYTAPLGHIDGNGDSVCDRCGERAFEEDTGNSIDTVLHLASGDLDITWTLVDKDFQDGCLYIADTGIDSKLIGGFDGDSYEESGIFNYFAYSFANESSVNENSLLSISEGGTTAWAAMLSEDEAILYRDLMGSGDYVSRTIGSTGLVAISDDLSTYEIDPTEGFMVRPAMILKKPEEGTVSDTHWNLGDTVSYEIDGVSYEFRCIDQNYSDKLENHTASALFLCEEVIPAGYGGEYLYEDDGSGHFEYIWHPGPISYFGESNDYKYSKIRSFLDDETVQKVYNAADLQIGIENAYTGASPEGKFDQISKTGLKAYPIGYQKMNARLFILSVDEALKYSDYLWKFNGSTADNPESQIESTCHSYWLRSPNGTSNDYPDTKMAYVVDLDLGNIHPEYVKPTGSTGDPYIDQQTNVGIRPAFTLPQR